MPARLGIRFSTALVVIAAAVIIPAASSAAAQALTVAPNVDLVDGETVSVTGDGFPASSLVAFCEGVITATPGAGDCGAGTINTVTSDSNGAFSVPFRIRRFITPSSAGVTVDCANPSNTCGIGAAPYSTLSPISSVVLAFRTQPSAAPPRPDLLVRNRSTGALYGDNIFSTTGAGVQTREHVFVNGQWVYAVVVQNDSSAADDLVVRVSGMVESHQLDVFLGYYNVTGVATSPAGISLPNVAPGQAITIGVRVTFNPRSVTDERMQVTAESAFAFELADTLDLRVCEQPSCNFAA
jgi:hypothetical protein